MHETARSDGKRPFSAYLLLLVSLAARDDLRVDQFVTRMAEPWADMPEVDRVLARTVAGRLAAEAGVLSLPGPHNAPIPGPAGETAGQRLIGD